VQAALVGRADIHAGTDTDSFQAFENLNILLAIAIIMTRVIRGLSIAIPMPAAIAASMQLSVVGCLFCYY